MSTNRAPGAQDGEGRLAHAFSTELRLVVIPDTDGDLEAGLARLEEALLALQPHHAADDVAPEGLGGDALGALGRIAGAVRSPPAHVEVFAADGRFELVPVSFVTLDDDDLATAGRAVAALGRCLLPGGDGLGADVVSGMVEGRETPQDLVALWARCHGLLDLPPTDDTERLAARLVGATGRVVLSGDEEAAYRRLTERVLALFHLDDPLDRFLYRGIGR